MSDLYVPKGYTMVYDDGEASTYFPTYSKATPADLIAAVRRGVESGTIKGEAVRWCEIHGGSATRQDVNGPSEHCDPMLEAAHRGIGIRPCYIVPALVISVDGEET